MKKFIISFTAIIITLSFYACNKSKTPEQVPEIQKSSVEQSKQKLDYDIAAEKLGEKDNLKAVKTKQMIENTINYIKKNGLDKTISGINDPTNEEHRKFIDGEFYIWILQTNNVDKAIVLAHATNKTLLGKDFFSIRDPDGKYFLQDIMRLCQIEQEGWVAYRWAHPDYKKAMSKVSYFKIYDNYIVVCGYYIDKK